MRWLWIAMLCGLPVFAGAVARGQEGAPPAAAPPVEQMVERMVRRAELAAKTTNGVTYAWRRLTVIEDFDTRGRVEERRTKEHTVVGHGSDQEATLVKVNDRNPTDREQNREQKREAENRDKYARRGDRRGSVELDETLIRRFRYQWLSNELVDGRLFFVLAFAPLPQRDASKVADRVLGHLGGRIWVDAEVYEVGRIEADLQKKLSIGGFIAELNELGFVIVRKPLPSGAWVNVRLESHAAGRKFFDRFSGRMEVLQEDFQPLSPSLEGGAAPGASPAPIP